MLAADGIEPQKVRDFNMPSTKTPITPPWQTMAIVPPGFELTIFLMALLTLSLKLPKRSASGILFLYGSFFK